MGRKEREGIVTGRLVGVDGVLDAAGHPFFEMRIVPGTVR